MLVPLKRGARLPILLRIHDKCCELATGDNVTRSTTFTGLHRKHSREVHAPLASLWCRPRGLRGHRGACLSGDAESHEWPTSARRASVGAPKRGRTIRVWPRTTVSECPRPRWTRESPRQRRRRRPNDDDDRVDHASDDDVPQRRFRRPHDESATTATPTTTPTTTTASPAGLVYVSPTGSGTQCSDASPCALSFALSGGNGLVQAGKTVRLKPGQYVGCFESKLVGARVEATPGQRVQLIGNTPSCPVLQILGSDTSYVGSM